MGDMQPLVGNLKRYQKASFSLIGVLLKELAGSLTSSPREHQRRSNLFKELTCETCNGSGTIATCDGIECPDCDMHGFTIPAECACRVGTGEDAGQEPCLYCRGQQVRVEPKEWS